MVFKPEKFGVIINMFIICFMILWLCLGYLWFYDKNFNSDEMNLIYSILQEKDFSFLVNSLGKKSVAKSIRERLIYAIAAFILSISYFSTELTYQNILISILCACGVYKLTYVALKSKYKKELKVAQKLFPYYLNSLCILVQNNPIPLAVSKSIQDAPELFKNDLTILALDIHEGKKKGVKPYQDFADKYKQIPDLSRISRTLYNISITVSNRDKILSALSKMSNEKVNTARKMKLDEFLDKQALFPWIGFLWVGLVIIAFFGTIQLDMLG